MNMTGVNKTYNYNQIPDYQSTYKPKISELVDNIQNYDYNKFLGTDEYGALRGQYERQGQRAMQDTLGDAAARTGGMASSYAVTAGQQAYGNQMNNLEAAAREMYQSKKTDMRNDLSMYENLDNMDYSRYADQLAQNNANRQFNYNMLSDTKSAADTLTQGKETAGESVGDYSAYVDAGLMTQAQADNAEKIWAIKNPEAAVAIGHKYAALAQAAIAASSSKSSGGGRSKGGSGSKGKNTKSDTGKGGETNNVYAFKNVNTLLAQGWNTVQLHQYLDEQYKAGNINKYTYEQSLKAIQVHAGSQRRNG